MSDWFILCISFAALIFAIGTSLLRARELGLPQDESLLFWQRPLIAGKQTELRQLVPEYLKRKHIRRAWFPLRVEYLVFLFIFGQTLLRQMDNTILPRLEEQTGANFFEWTWMLLCLLLMPMVFSQFLAQMRARGQQKIDLIEPIVFAPIQRTGLFVTMFLVLVIAAMQAINGDTALTTLFWGIVLIFSAPAILVFFFSTRSCERLNRSGYVGPFQYIPWNSMLNYRWYDDRTGILLLVDHWSASPLLILPVPDGKADEVQALLDEVLPGKREEDVEPALARIESGQMAEAV